MYWIVSTFNQTGLTPVIYIYDLSDNSLLVDGANMTEVAKGGYKYNFTTWDGAKDYFVVCDAGSGRVAYQTISGSRVVEDGHTQDDIQRIMLSMRANLCSGGGTANQKFRNVADSKERVTLVVDTNGNRLSSTLDGTI